MNQQLSERQRFWRDHVEACGASGRTMKDYAEEHGLALRQFYTWKSKLARMGGLSSRAGSSGAWVPVHVTEIGGGEPAAGFCQIRLPNGIGVEWPLGAAASELEAVMQALEMRR